MQFPDNVSIIAPCGMNCGICRAYLRDKNKCPGCRGDDDRKQKSCLNCRIKNCEELKNNDFTYCSSCSLFPCDRIRHLDKRYRTKYNMSMIENLDTINKLGIRKFVENEKMRWACSECGGTICVHTGDCYTCSKKR